jgi:hypothetical protein
MGGDGLGVDKTEVLGLGGRKGWRCSRLTVVEDRMSRATRDKNEMTTEIEDGSVTRGNDAIEGRYDAKRDGRLLHRCETRLGMDLFSLHILWRTRLGRTTPKIPGISWEGHTFTFVGTGPYLTFSFISCLPISLGFLWMVSYFLGPCYDCCG